MSKQNHLSSDTKRGKEVFVLLEGAEEPIVRLFWAN